MDTKIGQNQLSNEKRKRAINNKNRGKNLERKVVKLARAEGLEAHRTWGSNGRSEQLPENVDVVLRPSVGSPVHLQCKKSKRLRKDFRPDPNIFGVVIEEDRQAPLILLRLEDFLDWAANISCPSALSDGK